MRIKNDGDDDVGFKTGRSAFAQRILPLDRPAIDSLSLLSIL